MSNDPTISITVRLFASYREAVGQRELDMALPVGATVATVWQRLAADYAGLRLFSGTVVGVVNNAYVSLDQALHPGDEVAFLPPVAGGDHFAIVEGPIDEAALRAAVADPGAGAILTFLGVTRDETAGRAVSHLEYEAFTALAERQMAALAAELRQRWPSVRGVALVHRVGRLAIGEASIGIAVSTPHRADAFAACRYAIDRAKQQLPIWKKEVWADGESWIEEGPGGGI